MAEPPECPVELEPFEADGPMRPRQLPCGHSISEHSLQEILQHPERMCPVCRLDLPHPTLDAYPVNYTLCSAISRDTERWGLGQQRVRVLRNQCFDWGDHHGVFVGELNEGGVWNRVAVKEIDLQNAPDATYNAAMNEVAILARVARSVGPGAVELKGYVHVPRSVFSIVTELPRDDLLAWMREGGGRLSVPDAVLMAIQASDTLRRVHSIDVVHGGVSPLTVVRSGMGLVKLAGCGAVSPSGGDCTDEFCAPEQAAGEAATDRSDVWALAAVTLFAITGAPLYPEGVDGGPKAAPEMPDEPPLPPRLTALLLECFALRPARRPSASNVNRRLLAIRDVMQAAPLAAAPPPPAPVMQARPIERQPSIVPPAPPARIDYLEDLALLATTELCGTVIDLEGRHLVSSGSYRHSAERVEDLFCLRLCGVGTTISNADLTLPRDVVLLLDADRVVLINVRIVVTGELDRVGAGLRCSGPECRASLISCTLQRCRVEVVARASALLSTCHVEDARQDAVAVRDGARAALQGCVLSGARLGALVVSGAGSAAEAEDCEFQGAKECGVHVTDGASAALRDCVVAGAERDALRVEGDGSAATATDCQFQAPRVSGVAVDGGARATLTRCACAGAGKSALSVGRGSDVAASECTFEGSEASVVNVWGAATARLTACTVGGSHKSYGLHVKGARTRLHAADCTVSDNQQCGVLVCDGATAELRDCVAKGARLLNGLTVQDAGSAAVARGCTFSDNAVCAVGVVAGASVTLVGCVATKSRTRDGLFVADAGSAAECEDCKFVANWRCGVFVAAGGRAELHRCECSGAVEMGGVWVQNAGSRVAASHCRVVNNLLAGIKVAAGAFAKLADCTIADSKKAHALELDGADSEVNAMRCTFNNTNKKCGVSADSGRKVGLMGSGRKAAPTAVLRACVCNGIKSRHCACAASPTGNG